MPNHHSNPPLAETSAGRRRRRSSKLEREPELQDGSSAEGRTEASPSERAAEPSRLTPAAPSTRGATEAPARSLRPADPTGIERYFDPDEIIVSKTDVKGRITYANEVFLRVADYTEHEILGQPHSLIRHPDMPRGVFSLLWETIAAGEEIFAYVVNLTRSGDHYWVFAHVTPTFGPDGAIIGYHSNRRVPRRQALRVVEPLYREMRAVEAKATSKREGALASRALLEEKLEKMGVAYDELMFALATDQEG